MADYREGENYGRELSGVHWREAQRATEQRSTDFQRGFWTTYRKRYV